MILDTPEKSKADRTEQCLPDPKDKQGRCFRCAEKHLVCSQLDFAPLRNPAADQIAKMSGTQGNNVQTSVANGCQDRVGNPEAQSLYNSYQRRMSTSSTRPRSSGFQAQSNNRSMYNPSTASKLQYETPTRQNIVNNRQQHALYSHNPEYRQPFVTLNRGYHNAFVTDQRQATYEPERHRTSDMMISPQEMYTGSPSFLDFLQDANNSYLNSYESESEETQRGGTRYRY